MSFLLYFPQINPFQPFFYIKRFNFLVFTYLRLLWYMKNNNNNLIESVPQGKDVK